MGSLNSDTRCLTVTDAYNLILETRFLLGIGTLCFATNIFGSSLNSTNRLFFCQPFISAENIISVVLFTMLITPSLSTSLMRRQTEPPGTLVTTLNSLPKSSISINLLEDDAGGQTMQESRTSLRIILDASPPAPTAITDEILNRLMHRFAGQAKVYRDNDYQTVAKVLWWKLPCAPQPQHVFLCQSKRKWEAAMQGWRKELRKLSLEAVVTLLSTRCNTAVVALQQWFMRQWLPCIVHTELETLNYIPDCWCMFQLFYLCFPLHMAFISLSLDV